MSDTQPINKSWNAEQDHIRRLKEYQARYPKPEETIARLAARVARLEEAAKEVIASWEADFDCRVASISIEALRAALAEEPGK